MLYPGVRKCRTGLYAAIVATAAVTAQAQTPQITVTGLPAEPLIGETFCTTVSFTNGAGTTGYGPYLISTVDAGISRISIDFVDIEPVLEPIGTFDASGVLVDPISGQTINGNEGGTALNVLYPIGAVEQGTPPLDMEFCGVVDVGTEPNVPLDLEFIPGFEFGDTPTGDNGAILGSSFTSTVTPQLARVTKTNSAPENERPPGPSHEFNYRYVLDISNGVTLDDVVLEDMLPPEVQWTGAPITVNAPLGAGCNTASLPTFPPTPGGTLIVECDAVTGSTSTDDLTVVVPVYITDILDESFDDSQLLTNIVTADYSYESDTFDDTDDSNVLAVHAAAQKNVSGGDTPGDTLTYTINFQLTDYPEDVPDAGADSFIITDVMPDGLEYLDTLDLLVINGTSYTISADEIYDPATGITLLSWDIAAAVNNADPMLPNAIEGSLTYEAEILTEYVDPPGPVQAGDAFTNSVILSYGLTEGGSGEDDSDSTSNIILNDTDKELTDPPPGSFDTIMPGTPVTFTLTKVIPAGSSSNVTIKDFLPAPVFDVTQAPQPVVNVIQGPAVSPVINAADNSVTLNYGDIVSYTPTTIEVDLIATVTTDPFADELFLTNLMQASYETTDGRVITEQNAAAITVGAPELVLTKGVASIDNPNATIDPDPVESPVDSNGANADAGDTVNFEITVENLGTQSAFNVTVLDPDVAGLQCQQGSIAVVDGNGDPLGFTGELENGLLLDDPLDANDGNPAEGGPPYGTDTAIINVDCVLAANVYPRQVITNTASVTWTSTSDPADNPFTPVEDDARVTIAAPLITKTVIGSEPGYTGDIFKLHIGEIATYRVEIAVPEGVSPNVRFEDVLDSGLVHLETTSIVFPAGVSSSLGNEAVIQANEGIIPANNDPSAEGVDRWKIFGPNRGDDGFGDITNANDDNDVADVIVIEYRARVINSVNNVNSTSLRNRARWYWNPDGIDRQNVQAKAERIVVVEPAFRMNKTFTPELGDNTTPPFVTIEFEHSGASTADAFDLKFVDLLPKDMGILNNAAGVSISDNCNTPNSLVVLDGISDELIIDWNEFDLDDGTCTISFQTEFLVPQVPAGFQFQNCAALFWESLSDFDQPLQGAPNSTIAAERTGDTTDPGGDANTYDVEACDTFQIYDVGIVKTVESSSQSHTDNNPGTPPGTEALAIGEIVVFNLVTTLPLAPTLDLKIRDLLPRTEMVLELIDIEHIALGADLTPTIFPPTKTITDTNGDGINDRGELDYGSVGHIIDPPDINDDDRILVQVTAKVLDLPANANERTDTNSAIVEFLPDATTTDNYPLELVEAVLQLDKVGSTTSVEAGDAVDFRLIVSHSSGSRTDAQNVSIEDVLPPEFSLVGGSLQVGDVCSAQPDAPPEIVGDTISATWTDFSLGATCEIEFSVTVSLAAISGQRITNVGEIEWTSLNRSEQTDLDDERGYSLTDAWTVVVSLPGLDKSMSSTNIIDTAFRADAPHRLTIGEEATFTLVTTFPDGTTLQARIEDVLPTNDVALEFVSSTITSIGADLTISSGPSVGDSATACSPPADECLNWILGAVVNAPDLREEPDEADQLTVELVAIVLDDPRNSGAPGEDKNLINTGNTYTSETTLTSTEQFDLVEPQLRIQKLTSNGGIEKTTMAGAEEEFTLLIEHRATSTANARSVQIIDMLNPEMQWVDDSTVETTCLGLDITSSPAPGVTGTVAFFFDRLTLVQGHCEIKYKVKMTDDLPIQGVFRNEALLNWESAPGSPESRQYDALAFAILISLEEADISKRVFATSATDSASDAGDPDIVDVLIGEQIEYTLSLRFAEGTTSNVILTDTFQVDGAGELEFLGGELFFVGDSITATPQDPVINGNTITVDVGDVVNSADRMTGLNDTVIIRLQMRAPDVAVNAAGDILLNETELSYSGLGGITLTESSEAEVEIIEPELTHVKTFTSLIDAVATIQLEVGNAGNGPAYDLSITDAFDEAIWVPGSLQEVTVPEGFAITESSSGGVTTVTIAAENPSTSPPPNQVLSPGESATIVFTMTLQNDGNPGPTRIPNTATLEGSSLPGDDDAERVYTEDASDELLLPALDLLKAWTGPSNPAVPGDVLTYTLTLQNTGDAPATDIVITDTPDPNGIFQVGSVVAPGGTIARGNTSGDTDVEVTYPSVGAGAEVTVTYSVQVPLPYPAGIAPDDVGEEQLVNQALATSEELPDILSDDPATPDEDDQTIAPLVADPIMSVSKTDGIDRVSPGDTLRYTVTYGNVGDQDATGVLLTEIVPLYTTFEPALSDPNWLCTDVIGGSTCTLDIDTLAGGASGTALFVVTIDNTVPPNVFEIVNDVMVEEDGLEFDRVPSDPSTDTDQDIDYLSAQPNIVIAKNDGGITVIPGQGYRYGIVYGNVGDQDASGVVLSEVVPDYTVFSRSLSTPGWVCAANTPGSVCTLDVGILNARSGSQADFGLITDFPAAAGVNLITNTAVLADDGSSQVGPLEVESSDITPVIANPDMEVTKTSDSPLPREGDVIVYDIRYRQVGNQDATGVVVREVVPPGTTYLAAESDAWSCADGDPGGTVCVLPIGDFGAGASGTAKFAVTRVTDEVDGQIVNIVETNDDGSNGVDPTPSNNIDILIIEFFDGRGIPVMPKLLLASLVLGLLVIAARYTRRRRP